MNRSYRLIVVISIVTFLQGCEILMPYVVVGAIATLPSRSSDKTSSESEENSESLPAPTALIDTAEKPVVYVDVSGTYVSDITTNNNWRFRKSEDRRLKIFISQNGNEITGTNKSKDLKISGVLEGDEISFFTWPSDISSDEIKGKWKINPDGVGLTGKWTHPHGGGKWNLTRVGPSASIIQNKSVSNSASENQPATYFDISGTYVSDRIDTNWALKNKAILRIKLNQNLNSVEGEFVKGLDGPIRGSIVQEKVEIIWEAGNCNSGEGTLSVDSDGSTLSGFLLCRSQGMRKYDVVFRKM